MALLAVPIAVQSMITVGVNMMDTIMVGRLGETELSAFSLANTFINIYHILCMGLSMGASVLAARFNGMKDQVDMQKSVAIMYRLTVLIASMFCIITLAAPETIMHIYSRETVIIERGVEYLRWSAVTYYLLGLSLTTTIILRAVEKQKVPLYTSFGAFFINIGANYIFIFGYFGMPRMGVPGAALSSCVNFPLSTQGQASAVGTIISAGYGFICGAYMPISQFSEGLQKVISFLPGTYGTSLLRNHALRGVFEEMSAQGFPEEIVEAIRDSVDCNLYFFGDKVELSSMYVVLIASIVIAVGLYVMMNVLSAKKGA